MIGASIPSRSQKRVRNIKTLQRLYSELRPVSGRGLSVLGGFVHVTAVKYDVQILPNRREKGRTEMHILLTAKVGVDKSSDFCCACEQVVLANHVVAQIVRNKRIKLLPKLRESSRVGAAQRVDKFEDGAGSPLKESAVVRNTEARYEHPIPFEHDVFYGTSQALADNVRISPLKRRCDARRRRW